MLGESSSLVLIVDKCRKVWHLYMGICISFHSAKSHGALVGKGDSH